jgi:hypothetical protein
MPALELTLKIGCSNNCKCCPQDKLLRAYSGPQEMTLEVFRKIMNHVPQNVEILFSGFCETFLNKNASTMIKEAYKDKHPVALYTTLVGAKKEDLDDLREIKFLNCTIHAPDEINFIYSYEEWMNLYTYFLSLDIPHSLMVLGPSKINATMHSPHTRAGNVKEEKFRIFGPIECRVGDGQALNNNIVLPDGDVYICCMSYNLQHKLGNLIVDDWNRIHSGYRYQRIVDLMNSENSNLLCRTCHEGVKLNVLANNN